jgi:hypothetical protein
MPSGPVISTVEPLTVPISNHAAVGSGTGGG